MINVSLSHPPTPYPYCYGPYCFKMHVSLFTLILTFCLSVFYIYRSWVTIQYNKEQRITWGLLVQSKHCTCTDWHLNYTICILQLKLKLHNLLEQHIHHFLKHKLLQYRPAHISAWADEQKFSYWVKMNTLTQKPQLSSLYQSSRTHDPTFTALIVVS